MKWAIGATALAALAIVLLAAAPRWIESRLNRVARTPTSPPSAAAARLHRQLVIVDLHSDLLLWARDPLVRSSHGHTDLPRLQEGNVALQVFAVVTKTPAGQNHHRNEADSDLISPLAVLQRWPAATWGSLTERALYQANRLHRAAARSQGRLVVVTSARDLERFLARRRAGEDVTAAVLALEGLHALEGQLANLDALYAAGFRIMGLTHFFDNEFAGSAHGVGKGGLTPLGRRAVRHMEQLGILVDLAHASPATIDDVLAMATRPVIVSHSGVQATCPGPRNLSDDQLRGIAATGGVVGIGFWHGAVCEPAVSAVVRAIRHAVDVAGIDHVALGSDFDGSTTVPFDAAGLPQLTQALLDAGFGAHEVRKIMGENVLRLFSRHLGVPEPAPDDAAGGSAAAERP